MRVAVFDEHGGYEGTAGLIRLRTRARVQCVPIPVGDFSDLHEYDVIIATRGSTKFDRAAFAALSNLRLLVQVGRSLGHIDFAAAAERGIAITVVDSGFSIGAAELTFGLMLALMRRIAASDAALRRGLWQPQLTPVLKGKTLGIVGLGRVGRHVASIATAFGMHVVATGPRLTEESASAAGADRCDLDDLLSRSDVVTLHVPLTAETRGLLDVRRLRLLRPSSYLVNTARGPIVDERALIDALQSGRIAGAALDVYDEEPLAPDHPFLALSNVVLTPHTGWPTDEAYERYLDAAAGVVIDYLDGREIPYITLGNDSGSTRSVR